jgi:hypothetical protein
MVVTQKSFRCRVAAVKSYCVKNFLVSISSCHSAQLKTIFMCSRSNAMSLVG